MSDNIVGGCQDCGRRITAGEAREEPEDGGVRFTITSDGAWHCLSHGVPSDLYERNPFAADPSLVPEPYGCVALMALMDDGETLCEQCVRDPSNPVEDRRIDPHGGFYTGWGVVGFFTSGECEDGETCAHYNRIIVPYNEEEVNDG